MAQYDFILAQRNSSNIWAETILAGTANSVVSLDATGLLTTKPFGVANGLATLGADGYVPLAQLPFEAYGQTFSVGSEAAMLALDAQPGDSAIRTDDGNHRWLLLGDDATDLTNWVRQFTTTDAPVQSVAGRTGAVVLTSSDVGLGNVPNIDTTNASNIATGTLSNSRLNASVTLLGNTTTGTGTSIVRSTSPTLTDVSLFQSANNTIAIYSKRYTDTDPTGYFVLFQNAITDTDLFEIDITGTLTIGIVPTTRLTGTLAAGQFPTLTGDVTTAGGALATTIANNAVTLAKFQQIATSSLLGRVTAATGNVEVLSVAQAKTLLNLTGTNSGDQTISLTGDVTGSGTGSFAATIANGAVTFAKIQNIATAGLLGRTTVGSGVVEELTLGNGLQFTGTALAANFGTSSTTIAIGNDTRFPASVTGLRKGAGAGSTDTAAAAGTDYIQPVSAPATAASTGTTGQFAFDGNYVYICTASNVWRRAAISIW